MLFSLHNYVRESKKSIATRPLKRLTFACARKCMFCYFGSRDYYPRRRSACMVGFSSQSVRLSICLFVRSITQKRMIPKCSNLVQGMILGYPRSGIGYCFGFQRSKAKVTGSITLHNNTSFPTIQLRFFTHLL